MRSDHHRLLRAAGFHDVTAIDVTAAFAATAAAWLAETEPYAEELARLEPPGADVEQAIGSRQAQLVGEGVGLGHGGVAVGAPVAADDPPFDLAGHRRQGDAVALIEQRSCLELIFDRHVAYLPGRVLGPSWLGAACVASNAR